jgi:hypothetical protein
MTDTEAITQAVDNFHNLTQQDLAKLEAFNTRIQHHTGPWSIPMGGEKAANGSVQMPWSQNDPLIFEFLTFMAELNLLPVFDWPRWDKGSDLFMSGDKTKYDQIDVKTALKLICAAYRKERFADGTLAYAFNSGGFPKLINRLTQLSHA